MRTRGTARGATLTALVMVAVAGPVVPAPARAATEVAGPALVQRISRGELIDLQDVTVRGDVDLRGVPAVTRPVRCERCTLTGTFDASRVVFEHSLELVGASAVGGALVLDGAVFGDRVDLGGLTVAGSARLRGARFRSSASFSEARLGAADFSDGRFEGRAAFDGTHFAGDAAFDRVSFAAHPSFVRAEFAGQAGFRSAAMPDGASFDFARFAGGASFERAEAAGVIALDDAEVTGDAVFSHFRTTGTLSLDGIEVDGGRLLLDQTSVHDLALPFEKIDKLANVQVQKDVLALLRSSAEARHDLSQANRAAYRLRVIEGQEKRGWWPRASDAVERRVAGYLVQPLNPLLSLAAALALATAARTTMRGCRAVLRRPGVHRRIEAATGLQRHLPHVHAHLVAAGRVPDPPVRPLTWLARLFRATVASAVTACKKAWTWDPRITVTAEDRLGSYAWAGARAAEWALYKVLAAVFVLALGNANPTVRQLIDSVAR